MRKIGLGTRTLAVAFGVLAAAGMVAPGVAAASSATRARVHGKSGTAGAGTSPRAVDQDVRVQAARQQRIDGFGASGAWWPNALDRFPGSAQQQLGELLFAPTGLHLSQYRYNIGGGGVGVTNPYKAPQSFLTPGGTYDWSADRAGLAFLQMAATYRVPELIGFVNSAPPQFTSDQRSCGGRLRPGQVDAYAAYLARVVGHLYSADHIRLSYISPMNEPDTSQPSCRQEGMAVPVGQRAAVLDAVARALSTTTARPRVIGDESSLISQLLDEEPDWLPAARRSVAVIAHHTYDYPGATTLARVADLGVTHWATEICCYDGQDFGGQYDPTMSSGLWLARTILGDLGVARDSAFDWWVAASPNIGCDPAKVPGCQDRVNAAGRNDGLVYFDPNWAQDGNDTLYLTKRYWALAAFSRYVRPGAVVHQVTGLAPGARALAFEGSRYWTVVAVNNSATERIDTSLRLPAGYPVTGARAFVTDDRANLAAAPVTVSGGEVSVQLPPRSIATIVVSVRSSGQPARSRSRKSTTTTTSSRAS